jgi:hypothetical protein
MPATRNGVIVAEEKMTDEVRAALEAQAQGLPPEVLQRAKDVEEEWGTWVAVQPIFVGSGRAHNIGDAVPAANVRELGYDRLGWVARRSTKAAKAATGEAE